MYVCTYVCMYVYIYICPSRFWPLRAPALQANVKAARLVPESSKVTSTATCGGRWEADEPEGQSQTVVGMCISCT